MNKCTLIIVLISLFSVASMAGEYKLIYGHTIEKLSANNLDEAVKAAYAIKESPIEVALGISKERLADFTMLLEQGHKFIELHVNRNIDRIIITPKNVSWKEIAESSYFKTRRVDGIAPAHGKTNPGVQRLYEIIQVLSEKAKSCEEGK